MDFSLIFRVLVYTFIIFVIPSNAKPTDFDYKTCYDSEGKPTRDGECGRIWGMHSKQPKETAVIEFGDRGLFADMPTFSSTRPPCAKGIKRTRFGNCRQQNKRVKCFTKSWQESIQKDADNAELSSVYKKNNVEPETKKNRFIFANVRNYYDNQSIQWDLV